MAIGLKSSRPGDARRRRNGGHLCPGLDHLDGLSRSPHRYRYAAQPPAVNQEDLYYAQFALVDEMNRKLLPQRPGVVDLYFLSFGAYARQDVFMREALYTKELFDDRFDTEGRSAALINNLDTMNEIPLASVSDQWRGRSGPWRTNSSSHELQYLLHF